MVKAALAEDARLAAGPTRLIETGTRLDAALGAAGLAVVGSTPLFRLVAAPRALPLFKRWNVRASW